MENHSNTPTEDNLQTDDSSATRRRRRRFSRKQKLSLIAEADRCNDVAALARLLEREGVFSSHLTVWRKQLSRQATAKAKKAAAKLETSALLAPRELIDRLELENAKLQRELLAANNVIELQRNNQRVPMNDYVARVDTGK